MAEIRIENFGGKIPRTSNRLLPPNFAQSAENCNLYSGELRGWSIPALVAELTGTVNTAYRIPDSGGDIWFTSQYSNVHVQKGALVNDTYDRYYWTSGSDAIPQYNTSARIDNGDAAWTLGAPAPSAAASIAASGGSSSLTVTRVFTYTFVSIYGEESAPAATVVGTGLVDDTWTLSNIKDHTDTPISGRGNFTSGTKRIYRTITSTSGQTDYFFVKEIDIATTSTDVSDTDETVAFNSVIESVGWDTPPTALEGLVTHPNGFMVGFVGRDLYFSEPYRPHAWPTKYILSCDSEIMGLGIVGNTIGIATKSHPYSCTGIRPDAMSLTKSSTVEPCLSKKSVVTLPNGVYYSSTNGLAWLSANGAQVITKTLMTKEEWQRDYSPDTLNACRYGVRYFAFETSTEGFLFDPQEERLSLVDISQPVPISDIYTDETSGDVYILSNNNVYEWDPEAITQPMTYTWMSKEFEFPKPVNLGAGMVKFDDSNFTIDNTYITSLETLNTDILATNKPISAINTTAINGVRPSILATYVSDMTTLNIQQQGSINGSDLVDISDYEEFSLVADLTVYADGTNVWENPVSDKVMFRLPDGFRAHTYQIKLISNADTYSIALTETPRSLGKV